MLGRTNRLPEGIELAKESLDWFRAQNEGPLQASSLLDVAILEWDAGNTERAAAYASDGVRVSDSAHPTLAVYARAWLSRFVLASGDTAEALRLAEDAYERRDAIVVHDPGDAIVDLAYAEALESAGRTAEARVVAERARDGLNEQARKIQDETLRRGFLERVPENRATLALARWLSTK